MSRLNVKPPLIMDRAEYRRWSEKQPRGRHERVAGEVIAMAPERIVHVRIKMRVWQALDQAIRAAGLKYEALGDGVTVEVGDDTDYEPDAVVNCGERIEDMDVAASNPVIVVEVLSPSTQSVDTGAKLTDYFRVPSVRHYLVIRADRALVTHHCRRDDGGIETQLLSAGHVSMEPPGISIALADLYSP